MVNFMKLLIPLKILLCSILTMIFISPQAFAEVCFQDSKVLDCFTSYEDQLRENHFDQLDQLVEVFKKAEKKPNFILIVGHAVQYKPDDSVNEMSNKRAFNVEIALRKKLQTNGVDTEQIRFVSYGVATSEPKYDNNNQTTRALNRRVEVNFEHIERLCVPKPKLVKRLNDAPKNHDIKKKDWKQVKCLKQKLVKHYSCKERLQGAFNMTSFVKNFEDGGGFYHVGECKQKKGKKLIKCLTRMQRTISSLTGSHSILAKDLLKFAMDQTTKAIKSSEYCRAARNNIKHAQVKNHYQACFRKEYEQAFSQCF